MSQAVLLEEFPVAERGKAMAMWGMGIVAAPILGPVLGGWITDTYSWRWVFYINVPVGIFSITTIALFVEDPPYIRRGALKMDAIGLGMLAVGMGSLQVMLDRGQEEDWFASRLIVVLAVLAFVFLVGFVIRELIVPDPIVRFRLLRYRNFAMGLILVFVLGFVLYGSLVLLPLFMQTLLGWSAVNAGIWTSPRGIGTALCMPIVGYLLGRGWDGRRLLVFGFAVAALALFGFSHMTLDSGTTDIFLHQINQGMGMAFIFVPLTTLTMDPIPREETGYATSLYSVMRNIGSSVGISFLTTWLARRAQVHQNVLIADANPYSLAFRERLQGTAQALVAQGMDAFTATRQALALVYGSIQRQASLLSILEVFRVMGVTFLMAIGLVVLMRRSIHGGAGRAAVH